MYCDSPSRDGTDGLFVDGDEFVKHHISGGEHAIRVQKSVEEVDGEEPEVGQSLQEALDTGVTDLQHLAGVHHLTEADVHVITVQAWIWPAQKKDEKTVGEQLQILGYIYIQYMYSK